MKRILFGVTSALVGLALFASPALAAAPNWDVSGSWVFDYHYGTTVNLHDMKLVQDGSGSLNGSGGAFSGSSPYIYPWTITSGLVDGDNISFTAKYDLLACSFTATGAIASDGKMGGTWSDNCDGERTGPWSTTVGVANKIGTYSYNFITIDNGMNGKWATDYFDSLVTITPDGKGCYDVVRKDGGTFEVLPGAISPGGNGTTLVGDGTKGTVSGGITLNICGTTNPSPKLPNPDDLSNVSAGYAEKYFGKFFTNINSFTYGNWEWIFKTCFNGTWTDNAVTEADYVPGNNAMGDITGTYIPCLTNKDQCKDNGWELYSSLLNFSNQGMCVSYLQANEHAGKQL